MRSRRALRRTASVPPSAAVFPLSVHASGRYLVDAQGDPFLIHGDTSWSLPSSLTDSEVDQYVDDRAAKGFSALLIEAPVFYFTPTGGTNNVDGVAPFANMDGNWSWTLNNAYWLRVDRFVNRCKGHGILAIINPAYWGYNGGSDGCYTQVQAQSDGTLQAYGAALANRYTQGNVAWSMGGDYSGANSGARDKQWQIIAGIRSVRTTDIVTAHSGPLSDSIGAGWTGYTGLNLNFTYAEMGNVYDWCATSYGRSGPVPFIMGEAIYEQERGTPISAAGLRRQSYQAMLSGACGQLFGNSPIWHFESPNAPYSYSGTWESNLDSTGSVQQQYVAQLFNAFQWWKLEPKTDTSLVTGSLSSGDTRICPALASDGTFAMIWVSSSQTLTVNTNALTGVAGNVRIRRYNGTDGSYTSINAGVAKTSSQSVATGGEGVIVVDGA